MDIFHEILKKYWGYDNFRPLQESIIHSIYSGQDTLGLMPTGGGKSITFQVPSMTMEGICLVITPLISLMKDQVDNLRDRGIKALAIYSGMSHNEILITLENAILGDYKFLYLSPERINTQLFQQKLGSMNFSMIVVDEAHCISQWGYDFRPSYMNIASIRGQLPGTPLLALTATATPEVVIDIQQSLGFKKNNLFKKSFKRDNLAYIVKETNDKQLSITEILRRINGSSIVYVRSRLKTKEFATKLTELGFSADYYHAGLSPEEKVRKQNEWKIGKTRIIVATNAFGMGIDKPDVRVVIHLDLPNSLEEYYQEAGRAGRDDNRAYAIILYSESDNRKLKQRIANEYPERSFITKVYESLAYFFQIAEGFGTEMSYDFDLYQFCSIYKYPLLPTHNALKIIELAGYIEYTDEIDNRSRLMFTLYRNELYKYEFSKEYEELINALLRLYTGLFADYVTIHEGNIASYTGKTRKEVYDMLKSLSKRNIIDYIPYKKTPFINYIKARVDTKYLSIPKIVLEDRKERFIKRISGITEYVERNDVCRSKILLSYFGEHDGKNCGQCDVCISQSRKKVDNQIFNAIALAIQNLLKENESLSAKELVTELKQFAKEDILYVIRFQLEQNIYQLDHIKIKLAHNTNA